MTAAKFERKMTKFLDKFGEEQKRDEERRESEVMLAI
jgi:hypothetical protein